MTQSSETACDFYLRKEWCVAPQPWLGYKGQPAGNCDLRSGITTGAGHCRQWNWVACWFSRWGVSLAN